MAIRHLINNDGLPFDTAELQELLQRLDALPDDKRVQYRNNNALAIAQNQSNKMLIVSGPGTGKSTLFKQKINYWLQNRPASKILALSFVRKLVADLQNDIEADQGLSKEQKQHVEVYTLHKYARSVVEKNNGSEYLKYNPHIGIISQSWKKLVWIDALIYVGQDNDYDYSWQNYENQLHNSAINASAEWQEIKRGYWALSKFYNAAGFADLIIYAKDALIENPALSEQDFFIIDEYQDFNLAEEELIKQLSQGALGVLIVGDDDQVLYEKLKSGKASLIRNIYKDKDFVNAMLPFCSRSGFHITKAAAHFILQDQDRGCIEKIFLPLLTDSNTPKIRLVACAMASTAVDYIKKFIEDNRQEIEVRMRDLRSGKAKDPFLLILTPAREFKFYSEHNASAELLQIVDEFRNEAKTYSSDYYKVLNYYSLARYPENNFTFRKVLKYESVSDENTGVFIKACINNGIRFCELREPTILNTLDKCRKIKEIIESLYIIEEKIANIAKLIQLSDPDFFKNELEKHAINSIQIQELEHKEEEAAELDAIDAQQRSSVEIVTIVGSKGLSSDHVIIIGFDDVNFSWITRNSFFVSLTRARKSLHIITALRSGGSHGPHHFIAKLPDRHIEFCKYKKTGQQISLFNNRGDFCRYFESVNFIQNKKRVKH